MNRPTSRGPGLAERLAQPLGASVVEDAVLFPTLRRPDAPDRLLMGVFDASGELVEDSLLDRRSGERGAPIPPGQLDIDVTAAVPEAIYCGVLYNHFGHFLLESIARIWFAGRYRHVPLIWAGASRWPSGTTLKAWQLEVLDVLGVSNACVVATTPTPVARLHMPDIGYRYDDWFHPQHAEFLAAYEGPPQEESVRVWLSRSRIAKDVRDLNATAVERRLAAAGWTISHPERQTVREQLDTLARASVVAGEEGSAFHTLMLMKDVRGKTFHIIRRLGAEHRNLHTVGNAREVDQTFHTLENEVVVKASGRRVTKVSANPAEVLEILDVPRLDEPAEATDSNATEVVERVARSIGAGSYLEVGVSRGSAIPHSTLPRRCAVTSELPFDPRAYETRDCRLFELPIHQYVACFDDPGDYDVIRVSAPDALAGLRRMVDTQPLSHRGTVWVLDLPEARNDAELLLLLLQDVIPSVALAVIEHGEVRRALGWRTPSDGSEPGPSNVDVSLLLRQRPHEVPQSKVERLDDVIEMLDAGAVRAKGPSVYSDVAPLPTENAVLRRQLRDLSQALAALQRLHAAAAREPKQGEPSPAVRLRAAGRRLRTAVTSSRAKRTGRWTKG